MRRAIVRPIPALESWQNDQATVETAWAVESRYGFQLLDALVIAAAQQQAAAILSRKTCSTGS